MYPTSGLAVTKPLPLLMLTIQRMEVAQDGDALRLACIQALHDRYGLTGTTYADLYSEMTLRCLPLFRDLADLGVPVEHIPDLMRASHEATDLIYIAIEQALAA